MMDLRSQGGGQGGGKPQQGNAGRGIGPMATEQVDGAAQFIGCCGVAADCVTPSGIAVVARSGVDGSGGGQVGAGLDQGTDLVVDFFGPAHRPGDRELGHGEFDRVTVHTRGRAAACA